jgi:glyoxylase-like metal-dependent hydrolase (beta-lactamase superfamily II)
MVAARSPGVGNGARTARARLAECLDVDITGSAQHEAWQARTLPPVEQLRPDLWSIPVPMSGPLRYVSVYVFALDGGGLGLIDTGWNSDEGWTALTDGLASIGARVEDVRGALITHMHPDHNGLSGRVREASGAWIAMHPADVAFIDRPGGRDPEEFVRRQVELLLGLGASRADAENDVGRPEDVEMIRRTAVPDRLIEDGELADLPGWSLRAVHTPGHTPGHLCFAEERTGLFFAGDHVLPRITPNISTMAGGAPDPLRDYLESLAAVGTTEPDEVLPAHEWRFRGLRSRTDELTAHHEHRLGELREAIRANPGSTAWQLAGHLTWSRPWEQYERGMRIFAVTETDAHLRLLASRGIITGSGSPAPAWTLAVR